MSRLVPPLYESWSQAWQRSLREGDGDRSVRRRGTVAKQRVLEHKPQRPHEQRRVG